MNFWLKTVIAYLVALGLGLGLPVVGLVGRDQTGWTGVGINAVALIGLIAAAFLVTLAIGRVFFPEFWWRSQIHHEDIYLFEGIYFVGGRTSRQKARIHKAIFGVDEKMRPWDLLFGAYVLVLILPHLFGAYSIYQMADRLIPQRPKLAETLHSSALSGFPVMREWKEVWSEDPALAVHIQKEIQRLEKIGNRKNPEWFQLAQLQLLEAFRIRENPDDTFQYSPGDSIVFDRIRGARAVASLDKILKKPDLERAGWSRGALALLGFFHLSAHDYRHAAEFFQQALAAVGDAEEAGITRFQIVLLAAQTAMLDGRPGEAETLLETILTDDRLPKTAYALATEHFAGAMRLGGKHERVEGMLAKAGELYKLQNDKRGLARVHLRMAALAVEQSRFDDATREMSLAAGLAHGQGDGFTLNLVESLAQFLPRSG